MQMKEVRHRMANASWSNAISKKQKIKDELWGKNKEQCYLKIEIETVMLNKMYKPSILR